MSDDKQWELFSEFGRRFNKHGRDDAIRVILRYIDGSKERPDWQRKVFADMTEEQRDAVRQLVYQAIDSSLHNILFMFEDGEISKIRLEKDDVIIDDVREVEKGALQGYAGIWADEYSQYPPSY